MQINTRSKEFSVEELLPETEYAMQARSVSGNKRSEWSPVYRFNTGKLGPSEEIATGITDVSQFFSVYDDTDDSYIILITVVGTMSVGSFIFPASNSNTPYTWIFKYKNGQVLWYTWARHVVSSGYTTGFLSISNVYIKNGKLFICGQPSGSFTYDVVDLGTSGLQWISSSLYGSSGLAILDTSLGEWLHVEANGSDGRITSPDLIFDPNSNSMYYFGGFIDTVSIFGQELVSYSGPPWTGNDYWDIFVAKVNLDTLQTEWVVRSGELVSIIAARGMLVGNSLMFQFNSFYTGTKYMRNGIERDSAYATTIPYEVSGLCGGGQRPHTTYIVKVDTTTGQWSSDRWSFYAPGGVGNLYINNQQSDAKAIVTYVPSLCSGNNAFNNIYYINDEPYAYPTPRYSTDEGLNYQTALVFEIQSDLSWNIVSRIDPFVSGVTSELGRYESVQLSNQDIYTSWRVNLPGGWSGGVTFGDSQELVISDNIPQYTKYIMKFDSSNRWSMIASWDGANIDSTYIFNIDNNNVGVGIAIPPTSEYSFGDQVLTNESSFYNVYLMKIKNDKIVPVVN